MPRFAILAHDHPAPHWDLLLETGPVLRSWQLLSPLDFDAPVAAVPAPDHRLLYLDYEGPVSAGRGTVNRVDAGSYTLEADEPDRLIIRLAGSRFIGRVTLARTDGSWLCRFEPD